MQHFCWYPPAESLWSADIHRCTSSSAISGRFPPAVPVPASRIRRFTEHSAHGRADAEEAVLDHEPDGDGPPSDGARAVPERRQRTHAPAVLVQTRRDRTRAAASDAALSRWKHEEAQLLLSFDMVYCGLNCYLYSIKIAVVRNQYFKPFILFFFFLFFLLLK